MQKKTAKKTLQERIPKKTSKKRPKSGGEKTPKNKKREKNVFSIFRKILNKIRKFQKSSTVLIGQ